MIRREEVAARLALNPELAATALASFIADAVATAGFSGVTVGLSGGVDSALAAALAVRALGAEAVRALSMPYRTSSESSSRDAAAVAKSLGLPLTTIDITPMIDPYFATYEPDADDVRRGNKMARERMTILFDQAKKHDCLVLGTSNKTEILLGYSTLFGDNASSLNPLGDLYKQQVWDLSRALELPREVVEKPPTADLWPGQTDEEELGFGYRLADEILYLLFDLGYSPSEAVALGYPEATVRDIAERERRNRYKRRLMLIARLSNSAVNLDREIPRD